MKQLLLTLFTACLLLGAGAQKVINDPNVELRSVGTFNKIEISSAFVVIITQTSASSVAVSSSIAGDNQNITTAVENGKLRIGYRNPGRKWQRNQNLKAYISVKDIEYLGGSGASKITIDGTLAAPSLKINLSGATDLKGNLAVNNALGLELSGASDVTLSGAVGSININASGASDVKAFDLTAGECNIDASGACNVRISVEKEMSADLSGASTVQYKGNAMIRNIKTSGASNISKKS